MSVFESMVGKVLGNLGSGSTQSGLAGEVLDMVGGAQGGGISGLMRAFEGKGLGEIIQSWIARGQNLPVSVEQIERVLGSEQLAKMGARFGIAPQTVAAQLSRLLPQVVDGLTPNGSVPDSDMLQEGLSLLRSRLN